MIKRYHKQQEQKKFYRINERIFATSLRLLDAEGKQIGVFPKEEALSRAKAAVVDLVEIAAQATPPVAKLIDFKKFLYQEEKKHREEKKKAKTTETKEVRLGPFMSDNDLENMAGRARGFLEDGDKVRFVVKFSGRQIIHPEFGFQITKKVIGMLSDMCRIEKESKLEGRQLITIIAPDKKGNNAKKENQEISQ